MSDSTVVTVPPVVGTHLIADVDVACPSIQQTFDPTTVIELIPFATQLPVSSTSPPAAPELELEDELLVAELELELLLVPDELPELDGLPPLLPPLLLPPSSPLVELPLHRSGSSHAFVRSPEPSRRVPIDSASKP